MQKKISVIIPIYNVQKYIKECIESVINQTYKNLEILCINDCGNDNSISIIEEYLKKDNRIKIINHNKNKGLAESRNTGINNATGEYIFFLDSDDYIKDDIIEKLYKKAEETNSDIVISKTEVFADENIQDLKDRVIEVSNYLKFKVEDNYQVSLNNFYEAITKISCVAWGKLFKTSFIRNNKLEFIKANIIHEDDGFNIKCLSRLPNISMIENTGVMYRIRQSSITSEIEKQKNLDKKISHMKKSLTDAIEYIYASYQKPEAYLLSNLIKTSNLYSYCFIGQKKLFSFKCSKYEKEIKIIISLFKTKITGNKTIVKILGIPVFNKRYKNLKISIIIPVFNTIKANNNEVYLKQNIESIINQTYKNIEILYIDNNSTDNSIDFIKSHTKGDERIKIYKQEKQGVSNARNLGIDKATGDYITFIDSDDFISHDYISKAVIALNRTKSDILIGDFSCVSNNRIYDSLRNIGIKKYGIKINDIYPYIECTPNIFFKTDLIKSNKIYQNTDISIGEDNLFNATAILKANKVNLYQSRDYFYQILNTSSSNVKSDKYLTFIDAYAKIFQISIEKFNHINDALIMYFITKYEHFYESLIDKEAFTKGYLDLLNKYDCYLKIRNKTNKKLLKVKERMKTRISQE